MRVSCICRRFPCCKRCFSGGQNGTDSMKQPDTQKCKCSRHRPLSVLRSLSWSHFPHPIFSNENLHTTEFFIRLRCPVVSFGFVDCNSCSYIFICWFYLLLSLSIFSLSFGLCTSILPFFVVVVACFVSLSSTLFIVFSFIWSCCAFFYLQNAILLRNIGSMDALFVAWFLSRYLSYQAPHRRIDRDE